MGGITGGVAVQTVVGGYPRQIELHMLSHVSIQIAAVCDFYMYMSHIEKGILKQDGECIPWPYCMLLTCMCM